MSYIGKQPVPQSLQSRQQFTGDGSTTTFVTLGGVELYEDVFLNGVRLSRVDNEYSFDGTTLTITPAPANGDTVSIILRNDHSELIALPITDSQGNNVLSESGGVVTLTADEANVGSNALVVDSSGNVGIGISSPTSQLTLATNSTIEMLGGSSVLKFTREDTTTIAGNPLGAIEFSHTDTDDAGVASKIIGEGDGSSGQGRISFYTGTPSALSERIRIDSSGNVGIGTGSSSLTNNLVIGFDDLGSGTIEFKSTTYASIAKIVGSHDSGTAEGSLRFHTRTAGNEPERMRIDSSGNVKISNLGTGTVYSNSGVLTNTNPSDLNLKENVVEVSYGLSEVRQLQPVEFDWIADEADKHELGFIAQEVQLIIPDLVNTYERIINEETGETEIGYGLESTQFIPVLVKAIQEQQTLIESQQSQIDALTARIEALEATP